MSIEAVRDYIDDHGELYLDALKALVAQPSVSATGEGVDACSRLLARIMEGFGIAPEWHATDTFPIITGKTSGPQDRPVVLFYGHYDVQPAEPLEAWTSPPFIPRVADARIYGRGSSDNKGQLLSHLCAVHALVTVLGELPAGARFLFEGDEESGSRSLGEFVASHAGTLRADVAYTSDGPLHYSGAPVVFFGARGLLYVEV